MQSFVTFCIYREKIGFVDNIRLVEQCKSGNRDAFGLLYKTYLPAMQEVVAYYIHNSEAAWDVIHDGFIIAFTSIGTLKNGSKVEAWLTTIMRNLSLQYLRNESARISATTQDAALDAAADETSDEEHEFTFDELNALIEKLPEGYGKVFRLAVLDGLPHKEIGEMLGIAPHSSSSQLTHAKAMLRRLIIKHRNEMGFLLIISALLVIWHGLFRHKEAIPSTPIISNHSIEPIIMETDTTSNQIASHDSISPKQKVMHKTTKLPAMEFIADTEINNDSLPSIVKESETNDTVSMMSDRIDIRDFITQNDIPFEKCNTKHDWSLSMAYTGSPEQNDLSRYMIPNPNEPDAEGPADEIEVTEKKRHYMPFVISVSANKQLTSRWSVEAGLRYTFLRSDFLSESELMKQETIQRIHYIGIPIKFNYRIVTHSNFSIYGHGGGALDIPINARQSIWEYSPPSGSFEKNIIHIQAPLQWSVESGIGLQYHFTPSVSIYAEPSLRYYFNTNSEIYTIRQYKPFEFTIPIGFRITW